MIVCCRHSALWALLAILSLPTVTLRADTFSALAFDNATVQPTKPRPAPNGKLYFNIEGTNNGAGGAFASFGVADFNGSALVDSNGNMMPGIPTALNAITIALTQANAGFTHDGGIKFYLVENTTTSIQTDDALVMFDLTDPAGEGLSGQLGTVHLLGSGTFTQVADGNQDTFSFSPDITTQDGSDTINYVLGIVGNGGTLRVVITPTDPDVAATYAGFNNTLYNGVQVAGPTLTVDVSF